VQQAPREGRGEGRDNREGREGRGERQRERRPRQDRNAAQTEAGGSEPQMGNGNNPPANTRPDDQPEASDKRADLAASAGADNNNGEPREKRSRDRYGRDRGRGERSGRNGQDEDRQASAPSERQASSSEQPVQPTLEGFAAASAVAAPVAAEAVAVATAPSQARAPAPVAAAATTPSAGLPRVAPFALPIDALAQMAQQSGLNWVNSDAEKIRLAQDAIAAQPEAIHVPREIAAPVVVDEGPLVLVETKRDLRNLNLPFEQNSAS